MKVPFINLYSQHEHLIDDLLEEFRALLGRGDFILGSPVKEFEKNFAEMLGAKHCIGVNSGTDALVLSLKARGIGPGDEVIVPAFSFIASADAVVRVGAKPVFVDVREDTMNINPELIPDVLTPETRAIIPVHLFGQACEMDLLMEIAESLNLALIEDVAQACGTRVKQKHCGTIGSVGCFSFYPTKNLGSIGDAGCIVTNDDNQAELLRSLRDHGRIADGTFEHIGYNSRMASVQALYLNQRLEEFEDSLLDRIENARYYAQLLAESGATCPTFKEDLSHTYNYYTIKVPERDKLRQFLTEQGIGTMVYYQRPLPYEPCFAHLGYEENDFPVSEEACRQVISLPNYPGIKKREIEIVSGLVREFLEKRVPVNS